MLRALDMLVGLAVVMLIVSVAVTTVVQIVAAVRNWRGKHLLEGVALLLAQAHPSLGPHAQAIANAVLKHPLLQVNGRLGDYVSKDELVRVLLALASGEVALAPVTRGLKATLGLLLSGESAVAALSDEARAALRDALARGGLPDPAAALKAMHLRALAIEAAQPELESKLRHAIAVVREAAKSEIVARMDAWFDHGMERVKQRFTYDMRKLTTICALGVALLLQLDALDLMRQLSVDSELREALVENASAALQAYDSSTTTPSPASVEDVLERVRTEQQSLSSVAGYSLLPRNWLEEWRFDKLPGILLSWVLLSLGAPFWYEALKNLLRLRSILATRDDQEEKAALTPPAVTATAVVAGEPEMAREAPDPGTNP